MAAIPQNADEITVDWLNEVTGWGVESLELKDIGVGLGVSSQVNRATLTGGSGPATCIVKSNAVDEAARFTTMMLKFGRREVRFYADLAATCPVHIPVSYYGDVADDDSSFVVVIEDMGANRLIDQVEGLGNHEAESCVDMMSVWHRHWWNKVDGLADNGTAIPLSTPLYPAMLPGLFDEGWAKLIASSACTPPDILGPIAAKFGPAVGPLLAALSNGPTTLLHGDFRADNVMFDSNDKPLLFDFQILGIGSPMYDLAYFVTQSLFPDVASAQERNLYGRWMANLESAGIPASELDGLWDQYRTAALFCLVYPVVAARGMDLDDPRQAGLVNVMMSRMARAAEELNLAELI